MDFAAPGSLPAIDSFNPTPRGRCIAVVIPAYRAAATIAAVIDGIGPEIDRIYVVDDGCPERTGDRVERDCTDPRVTVVRNHRNLGVGGAMKHGYRRALGDGADILVKLDADGQMAPAHIPHLIAPLLAGKAHYAKGNRFAPAADMPDGSSRSALKSMPAARRAANRLLGALHRPVTGYWRIGDPANGYTAIDAHALRRIRLDRLADCYFFETDMLFALSGFGAAIADVPLPARYGAPSGNLRLHRIAPRFAKLIVQRYLSRQWRALTAFRRA